jgi:hypothetical protein
MKETGFGDATSPSGCWGLTATSHSAVGGLGLVNFGDSRQVSPATLSSEQCFHYIESYLSVPPEDRSS